MDQIGSEKESKVRKEEISWILELNTSLVWSEMCNKYQKNVICFSSASCFADFVVENNVVELYK